jgi:23S rRNA pseudouridine2605 synthase
MTNDGDFANRLQHPKFKVSKTYLVKIKGGLSRKDVLTIREGVDLEDGKFAAEAVQVEKSNDKSCWVRLTIFEGRNRVIRRLFDKIGHPVARLIRTAIGDIVLGNLKTGEYRSLKSKEIQSLLRISG